MNCPESGRCSLRDRLHATASLAVWETLYCDSGFHRCVRYRMSLSHALVPVDLMPDGFTRLGLPVRAAAAGGAAGAEGGRATLRPA